MAFTRLLPRLASFACLLSALQTVGAQQSVPSPFSTASLRSGARLRLLAAGERAEGTVTSRAGATVVLSGKTVLTAGYPFAVIDSAWTGESYARPAWREGMKLGLLVGGATSAALIARMCWAGGCSPAHPVAR
jgi:hypothetical protein